ncbi:uncharacterized protein LOC117117083 [Anneissia japonica]|uniref:uncharacterized protein LOC117117083 n=1 Tax=Anneissia japonica TaxID=1529436 RepID=UPI001425B640|nr:uncharacterized protein LOC117117083 [Anneissia japonica]
MYTDVSCDKSHVKKLVHHRFLRGRIQYFSNSVATIQTELLISGDVQLNPGPRCLINKINRDSDQHLRPELCYNKDELFNLKPVRLIRLPNNLWSNIYSLGIAKTCHRGKKAGRRKRRNIPVHITVRTSDIKSLKHETCHILSVPKPNFSAMNICVGNARSLRKKSLLTCDYLIEHDIDVFIITEFWLRDEDKTVIGECTPPAYVFFSSPRKTGSGGGITVIAKRELKLCMKGVCSFVTFEHVHLANLSVLQGTLLVAGDFNFHVDTPDMANVNTFLRATAAASLKQHVSEPTHIHGHTLDLVFTRDDTSVIKKCVVSDKRMSDHFVVHVQVDMLVPKPEKIYQVSRDFKSIDKEGFLKELQEPIETYVHHGDVESAFQWYNNSLRDLLDKFAPPSVKKRQVRLRMPWYNVEVHLARREKRQAERKWRRIYLDTDYQHFLVKQREVTSLICRTKIAYFKNLSDTHEIKDIYRVLDTLLHRKQPSLPVYNSLITLCNNFSTYFFDKIHRIRRDLCNDHFNAVYDPCERDLQCSKSLSSFDLISEDELLKIILASPSKSCCLDPVPTWFLKQNINTMLPLVTDIVNASFATVELGKLEPNALSMEDITALCGGKKAVDKQLAKGNRL